MGNNLNPEQFGMSHREAAEIQGHAIAAHIWDGMEGILGNMKVSGQSAAYDHLRDRFPNHEVHIEEDGGPYISHSYQGHSIRYHGGSTFNYYRGARNVHASTDYDHKELSSEDIHSKLKSWVDEGGHDDL